MLCTRLLRSHPRPGVVHESSGASLEREGLASIAVADAPATSGNAGSPPACAQGARNQLWAGPVWPAELISAGAPRRVKSGGTLTRSRGSSGLLSHTRPPATTPGPTTHWNLGPRLVRS
jgi:hypothetical protein